MSSDHSRRSSTEIARSLLEQTIPILRCQPRLKRPYANGLGTWDTINDPEQLAGWLTPGDNLAVLLGGSKGSPIIRVGLDRYKNIQVMDRAQEVGVTFRGNTWSQRTGRGGYTVFYYDNSPPLKRDTAGCDGALDLLVSGYSLIGPSDTSREQQGGGPYSWLSVHSPGDIPCAELDELPKDLLVCWQSLSGFQVPNLHLNPEPNHSPSWLTGPIPEGQRNETLAKRAGHFHRKLDNEAAVRDLIHAANQTQCLPPLSRIEVDGILDSILRREGANHFRGVQQAKLERVLNV